MLDTKTQTFGIRRVQVVQEPLIDQPGRTFLFEVNGVRIFCGGQFLPWPTTVTVAYALLVDGQARTGFRPTRSLQRKL